MLQNHAYSQNKWYTMLSIDCFVVEKLKSFYISGSTHDMEWRATDVLIGHNLAFWALHHIIVKLLFDHTLSILLIIE